ncbi:MAG TPA: hypothetical protein VHL11_19395 [Phototrophicaceae bacterium]|jgi:hypothetical protein|nr:hypothetical protein [Phototrophicaceae bacterium]
MTLKAVEPNLKLMEAFGFDEDDLAANRMGVVSERQRQKLDGLYQSRRGWWWQTIAIILLIQGIGWVIALVTGNLVISPHDLPYILLFFVGLMLVFMLNSLYGIYINNRLKNGEVRVAEGRAHPKMTYARGESYTLWLGDSWLARRFQLLSGHEYQALKEGATYRLYYVASVPVTILSIEKLS